MNFTAVAHLTESGDPTATLFTNDTVPTAAGQRRLTVRHVAAEAPRRGTAGWEPYLPPRRGLQGRPLPPSDPN